MRVLHLFAGAGGGLLADLILGHTPVGAVEWDRYCCQVLRERSAEGWFPGLHVHEGDIRLFDPSEYAGRVDCIAAGFPCQDISSAGNRAGIAEGTRSGLWIEVVRVARILRPRYLFLENSSDILTLGLDTVLADLAELGFDARWCCVRASDVGANHIRDRWWLYGYANGEGEPVGAIDAEASTLPLGDDANANGARLQVGSDDTSEARRKRFASSRREFEQPYWWSVEPDVGRVVDGLASRVHRIKAIGNGQVPAQAALAWRILTA